MALFKQYLFFFCSHHQRYNPGASIWSRLDFVVVGFWCCSCIGVPSVHLSLLGMLSKASHGKNSCSKSGGIVGAFGSTPAARRLVTTARSIPPRMESTRIVAMTHRLSVGGKAYHSKSIAILAKSTR